MRRLVVIGAFLAIVACGCGKINAGASPQGLIVTTTTVAPGEPTGTVVGGIEPCVGISLAPVHFVSGTVVALRGSQTTVEIASGEYKPILPHTEVARQTVRSRQEYRFALPPGNYVLHVVRSRLASDLPTMSVTIVADHIIHANMPDGCP
jgi:hypothetical protein